LREKYFIKKYKFWGFFLNTKIFHNKFSIINYIKLKLNKNNIFAWESKGKIEIKFKEKKNINKNKPLNDFKNYLKNN
jgi:hypothetical protein